MDVDAYLRRIDYHGPRQCVPVTLQDLHRKHLFTVPFENLDIALKVPISLDLDLIYEKVVGRNRGGFCYELNGLFCKLLKALGFRVQMLSARVRRDDGGFGPEFDHMLLKVDLEDPWLVDVGFGDSFVDPILFRSGGADQVNGHRYLVLPADDDWLLVREDEKGQSPLYRFRDEPRQLDDYREMCHFHQTAPESGFTQRWICSRATPDGRITMANRRLIITRNSGREESVLTTDAEVRAGLSENFGIAFPATVDLARLGSEEKIKA